MRSNQQQQQQRNLTIKQVFNIGVAYLRYCFARAEDIDDDDSSDNADDEDNTFSESIDDIDDDPPIQVQIPTVTVTPSVDATTSISAIQVTNTAAPPSIPDIIKPGTASPECVVIADLYKATGPWRFVPDTVNCCNTEYPNSAAIKCNPNGQIVYIFLAGQGLTGPLQYLLLSYNGITGTIPASLGSIPLYILDLSHNRLEGSLPAAAEKWTALSTLNLEQNGLSGLLPGWVTTLPNLHSLALGQNFFITGDLPQAFSFNVEPTFNLTTGTVVPSTPTFPASVGPANYTPPASIFLEAFTHLPKLRQLKLDSLNIVGGFPASWEQKMINLTKLDLSNNSMQGLIPGYFDQYRGLKTLLLDRNEFGGVIPSLDSLKSLTILDMSYNQLSGSLPTWAAGLNITTLNLSNNLLSGPLPMDNHRIWRAFRPAFNMTLPDIKVKQTHNGAHSLSTSLTIINALVTMMGVVSTALIL
ncbi:hypothetical protein BGW38_002466 [Lunasporangiospora selenospora]|uniref:L domain-like protein n=1 Tax=Lunasporangiospora selenospora TaxID=979761 RepID=A0A9P6KHY9_9FUNG|nr:hypothetical protein BGW38_002466 [Lunasporangiospora selenospora]